MSINAAGRKLGLKRSTAKQVILRYRKEQKEALSHLADEFEENRPSISPIIESGNVSQFQSLPMQFYWPPFNGVSFYATMNPVQYPYQMF